MTRAFGLFKKQLAKASLNTFAVPACVKPSKPSKILLKICNQPVNDEIDFRFRVSITTNIDY